MDTSVQKNVGRAVYFTNLTKASSANGDALKRDIKSVIRDVKNHAHMYHAMIHVKDK